MDITNYVLHDLGQPLHAFDLDRIKDGIVVKTVDQDTPFITLDGIERKLNAEDLMICDHHKPLCIAGIYGGLDSGVNENTTSIFLESAYFNPVSIRKSAKRHGLNTDASFRFERGIDPEITVYALKRAANLIVELTGGTIESELFEIKQGMPNSSKFNLTFDQINKTIGQNISKDEISKILKGLEIKIVDSNDESMLVEIPRYRVDVTRPADVIEEILRIYGYNNVDISRVLHSNIPDFVGSDDHQITERLSNQLVSLGFNEMVNNSITRPDYGEITQSIKSVKGVNIINPLGKELSQMRTTLLPGALEVVAFNLNRQSKSLKLYEFGKIYQQEKDGFKEEKKLSLIICGDVVKDNWNVTHQPQLFFYFKGIIQHILQKNCPFECEESTTKNYVYSEGLNYSQNGNSLLDFGFVKKEILRQFEINQEVLYAELDFSLIADISKSSSILYQEIPKFPLVRRDFALQLDNSIPFNKLKKIAFKTEKYILNSVELFDVYEGDNIPRGKKSYGVSFYFQDPKKTLTDQHVDKIMGKLQNQFEKQLGAKLR